MDQRVLLQAVADGRVKRLGQEYAAAYDLEGQPVERMQLVWLKRSAWIDMPISGPPSITPDGQKWLREQGASS